MKKYNWFDENIEGLKLQRWHKNWVMFTEFALDIIIRVLIVVAIGIVIIELSK